MPFTTLNLGLTLTIPTNGTRNYGTTMFNTTWTKISGHRHTGAPDGAQLITDSFADNAVTSAKLAKNIALGTAAPLAPAGTTQTIDFSTGNNQAMSLAGASGDVLTTLSNPQAGARYIILVTTGSPARDIIWPASVLWPQAVKPIFEANQVMRVELYYNGANYIGTWEPDVR